LNFPAKKGSVFYATFLVMGTSIGTSFLTIPIMTGISGFFPGILMSFLIWLFTMVNGMLYAEATFGNPNGANFYTISKAFLGQAAAFILSAVFLASLYAYISASLLSGAAFLTWFSAHFFGFNIPSFAGCTLLAILLGTIIFFGILAASRTNFILLAGFVVAFIVAFYHASEHLEIHRLAQSAWIYIFFAVPMLFSSFGFNAIVPTLCTYLNREKKRVQLSIFFGVTGTLIIYILWQWMMLGTVGKSIFWIAFSEERQLTQAFPWVKNFPMLIHALNFIVVFAATTSIIGITLSLIDFYSDCFSIPLAKRIGKKRFFICLLILLPSLLFTLLFKVELILKLIDYVVAPAGSILINGLIPIILVAKARYYLRLPTPKFVPGGGYLLIIMGLAVFFLIYLQGIILIQ
jgi:tyrosine-specific transport protein